MAKLVQQVVAMWKCCGNLQVDQNKGCELSATLKFLFKEHFQPEVVFPDQNLCPAIRNQQYSARNHFQKYLKKMFDRDQSEKMHD